MLRRDRLPRGLRAFMTIKLSSTGRKTRSLEEQLNKLRQQEKGEEDNLERELSFQPEGAPKKAIGGGTKTLAQRLSQSLRDPLRSKDYCGTVDKGEITIDCHHHSKVIMFKNRKGYLSPSAMENLTELIQLSDTNWYEKFSILKGGAEGFCAGLLPEKAHHADGRRDLEAQGMLYRLGWLLARSKKRRIAMLDGPCLGAGAAMALNHWNPDAAVAFHRQLGTNGAAGHASNQGGKAVQTNQRERNSLTDSSFKSKPVEHIRIGTGRMQLSFQNAHFLGAYPGVGASFYLPRLRGHIGMYLALTGARINVEDALYSGAVTHYVQTHRMDKLQKALTDSDFSISDDEVMAIVEDFAVSASELQLIHQDPHFKADKHPPSSSYYQRYILQGVPEPTHLEDNIDDIDRCFGQTTLQGLVLALQATDSDWGRSTLERVESMSPTALKVTFALLRRAATCDNLEECVRTEWRLAHRSWPDQREGVRAFEKEKDGKPVWSETLSNEEVSALFQPIDPARMSKLNLVQDHLKSTPPSSPSQSMPGVSK
jgi:enoyl-CoA hydratase/carnithine racemase